jgi:hypothetical protein
LEPSRFAFQATQDTAKKAFAFAVPDYGGHDGGHGKKTKGCSTEKGASSRAFLSNQYYNPSFFSFNASLLPDLRASSKFRHYYSAVQRLKYCRNSGRLSLHPIKSVDPAII